MYLMCFIDIIDLLFTKDLNKLETSAVQIGKSIKVEDSKSFNGKYLPILVMFII